MTLALDVVLLIVFALALVAGWRNGIIREVAAVGGLVLGLAVAVRFTGWTLAKLPPHIGHLAFLRPLGFIVLFLASYFLLQLIGGILAHTVEGKEPSRMSRVLALLPGAARGFGLVLVLTGGIVLLAPRGSDVLSRSQVLPYLDQALVRTSALLPADVGDRLRRRWQALSFHKKGDGTAPVEDAA